MSRISDLYSEDELKKLYTNSDPEPDNDSDEPVEAPEKKRVRFANQPRRPRRDCPSAPNQPRKEGMSVSGVTDFVKRNAITIIILIIGYFIVSSETVSNLISERVSENAHIVTLISGTLLAAVYLAATILININA